MTDHPRYWALALLLTSSCVMATDPGEMFDGHSHWLRLCETSAACGGNFECICGRCTATCRAPGDCDGLEGGFCAEASLMASLAGSEGACSSPEQTEFVCVGEPPPEAAPAAGLTQHAVTLVSWFDGDPVEGSTYDVRLTEGSPAPTRSRGDVELESDPDSGALLLATPPSGDLAFHIVGGSYTVGEGREAIAFETYDSIVLNFSWKRGDRRLHVPLVHIADYEQAIADVTLARGRASLTGHLYWGPGREIRGGVGCAQLFLDDDTTGVDLDAAQRYLDGDRLPLALEDQTETRGNGGFYFGNLEPGRHRFQVTLDGGATFIAKENVEITMVREDAWGPVPLLLYQFDIHIDTDEDPTPTSCVTPG